METIGDRIKAVREKASLSQKAFGQRVELSQTAVNALENNKSEPRLSSFNKIVEAFHVSPEWLRTGEGDMKSSAAIVLNPPPPPGSPLQIVAEAEQIRDLKRQLDEANKQLQFMRELIRSGLDLGRLSSTGTDGPSFLLGNHNSAEYSARTMWALQA